MSPPDPAQTPGIFPHPRIRRRPFKPIAPPHVSSQSPQLRVPGTPVSEGPTIKGIRTAFAETPVRLRELEAGWRDKRRGAGAGILLERDLNRQDLRMEMAKGEEMSGAVTCVEAVSRPRFGPDPTTVRIKALPAAADLAMPSPANSAQDAISGHPTLPSPPPTPPSSPHTIPLPKDPITSNARTRIRPSTHICTTTSNTHHRPPSPILAAPLPPTTSPARLSKRTRDTIHIHSASLASPYSLTLHLQKSGQAVRVSKDGKTIYLGSRNEMLSTGQASGQIISLDDWKEWSNDIRRQWEAVRKLVEGYKRITPKVRIYLPLGHLVITCSNPPDIILNFAFTPINPSTETISSISRIVKVRIRLSRLLGEITIDTSDVGTGGSGRLRTKRVVPLHVPPTPAIRQGSSQDGIGGAVYITQQILAEVGMRSRGWTATEQEGWKRLSELQTEWERFEA